MRRVAGLALLLVLLASACGSGHDHDDEAGGEPADEEHTHNEPAAAFTEEEADTRAEVSLKDFAFVGLPADLKGPKLYLRLVNVGTVQHELLVIDGGGREVAASSPFPTGNTKTLVAELPPGSYTVECRVKEGDKLHSDLGMKMPVSVT